MIAWVGTITAVMAALIATQQNDIKRILAYSTLSQLGYMVLSIGVASSHAAMFHLFTHAFFKALLFLGAGSVIHALHHEQDIWKMGALKNRMPVTFLTFAIATLALTGCPGFSGFFSKDAILMAANDRSHLIFSLALMTAFLTAFYMFRLFVVVFLGRAKSDQAKHGHEGPGVMTVPLVPLAIPSLIGGYAFFAGHFLDLPHEENARISLMILPVVAFASGAVVAWILYAGKTEDPVHIPLFANKFYVDEIYTVVIRWTHDLLATFCGWFDRWVLDGALVRGLFGGGTWASGFVLRFAQVGNLQAYVFLFGIGAIALLFFILLK